MRRPALLAAGLLCLAVFFGWKARDAWLAQAPSAGGGGRGSAELWHPGAPVPDPPGTREASGPVSVISARPLFRPDRRPFGEEGKAPPGRNYEAELSRLSLIGTLTFGGELRGIVVGSPGAQSERWEVKAGDALAGFTVKDVQVDSLVITADDRVFTLPLYAGPPTAAGSIRTEGPRAAPAPAARPPAALAPPAMRARPPAPASQFVPPRGPARPYLGIPSKKP